MEPHDPCYRCSGRGITLDARGRREDCGPCWGTGRNLWALAFDLMICAGIVFSLIVLMMVSQGAA